MPMIVKSFTISHDVSSSQHRNGVETSRTIHSEAGIRAELLLLPSKRLRDPQKPDRAHASIVIEIDSPPDIPTSGVDAWLRDQLLEMLAEDDVVEGAA
jgi:hypothetical protein